MVKSNYSPKFDESDYVTMSGRSAIAHLAYRSGWRAACGQVLPRSYVASESRQVTCYRCRQTLKMRFAASQGFTG